MTPKSSPLLHERRAHHRAAASGSPPRSSRTPRRAARRPPRSAGAWLDDALDDRVRHARDRVLDGLARARCAPPSRVISPSSIRMRKPLSAWVTSSSASMSSSSSRGEVARAEEPLGEADEPLASPRAAGPALRPERRGRARRLVEGEASSLAAQRGCGRRRRGAPSTLRLPFTSSRRRRGRRRCSPGRRSGCAAPSAAGRRPASADVVLGAAPELVMPARRALIGALPAVRRCGTMQGAPRRRRLPRRPTRARPSRRPRRGELRLDARHVVLVGVHDAVGVQRPEQPGRTYFTTSTREEQRPVRVGVRRAAEQPRLRGRAASGPVLRDLVVEEDRGEVHRGRARPARPRWRCPWRDRRSGTARRRAASS